MSELRKNEVQNTIQSLEQSILYWREKIPGAFADKVKELGKNYWIYLKR